MKGLVVVVALLLEGCATSRPERASDAPAVSRDRTITLRVAATVDGRNTLIVQRDRARWEQHEFGWPSDVTINGVKWDPAKSPNLRNAGSTAFLTVAPHFRTAALVDKRGRNLVVVQADANEARIYFNDTDPGASRYELVIEFAPAAAG